MADHPTTSYIEVLKDKNIDICVIGEGEVTLEEIINNLIENNGKKLVANQLDKIDGIAYNNKFCKKFNYQKSISREERKYQTSLKVNRLWK